VPRCWKNGTRNNACEAFQCGNISLIRGRSIKAFVLALLSLQKISPASDTPFCEFSFSHGALFCRRFCKEAKALVETHPEKTYILVGGTGLYLQSLIGGLPELPVISESIRLLC
jgi:hypothetical protein